MKNFDYLKLGATLYVPATRSDVTAIACNHKLANLRSVIFCTEDSILETDVPAALENIQRALRVMGPSPQKLRFVRVRNLEVFKQCLQLADVEKLDGFVLPKTTLASFKDYIAALPADSQFKLMPTLETREALDPLEMAQLRDFIIEGGHAPRILSLRIGGNDLLNLFGLRRPSGETMYETPLRFIISQLVSCFRPYGFNLTSPVCELIHARDILNSEVRLDLYHGLFGKTAIHPDQIALIEQHYRVDADQVEAARKILKDASPAVFQHDGAMCEPATHRNWAEQLLARAEIYGVHGERLELVA